MLLLIIVLGAVLGLIVLWFTLLRHERTVKRRNRGQSEEEPEPDEEEAAQAATQTT